MSGGLRPPDHAPKPTTGRNRCQCCRCCRQTSLACSTIRRYSRCHSSPSNRGFPLHRAGPRCGRSRHRRVRSSLDPARGHRRNRVPGHPQRRVRGTPSALATVLLVKEWSERAERGFALGGVFFCLERASLVGVPAVLADIRELAGAVQATTCALARWEELGVLLAARSPLRSRIAVDDVGPSSRR